MLSVGLCGLHTIHGAYGDVIKATTWDTECFLSSCLYLFKHSPARREDFTSYLIQHFPSEVCSSSLGWECTSYWVLEVLPALRQYKQAIDGKKVKSSDTKSYKHVADGSADPLLEVKLQFMPSIAKILQAFLLRFQTDKPMLPFLVSDEVDLVQDLLAKFVSRKTLDTLKTTADLCTSSMWKRMKLICKWTWVFQLNNYFASMHQWKRRKLPTEMFSVWDKMPSHCW